MSAPRGQVFIRTMRSLALAKGVPEFAVAYAESQRWLTSVSEDVIRSIRMAAVTPIGTADFVPPTPAAYDFAEYIRPLTIIGKLQGLRRVPFRVRAIAATAGSGAYWSGEKNPRPISRETFTGSTLEQLSVIASLVSTNELFMSTLPSAENVLLRDLAAAAVQAMDQAFIDVTNLGVAGAMPAAITNGVTSIHSSGGSLAQVDSDLQILIQALSDAGSTLEFATFVMRPRTALYLSSLRGTGGALAFPQMTVKGGFIAGLPVIVSSASRSDAGSPSDGGTITLLDPSQVLVADDGGGAFSVSTETNMQMVDNPAAPSTTVSMFQTNSAALRTIRYANWQRCRAGMAQVLDQVAY